MVVPIETTGPPALAPFALTERKNLMNYLEQTGLAKTDTFMINIEMVNDKARMQLAPGKPKKEKYLQIFNQLANLGYGVSTVIQTNFYPELEPIKEVAEFISKTYEIGLGKVVPELLVSRAVPKSKLNDIYWKTLSKDFVDREEVWPIMLKRFELFNERLKVLQGAMEDKYFQKPTKGYAKRQK